MARVPRGSVPPESAADLVTASEPTPADRERARGAWREDVTASGAGEFRDLLDAPPVRRRSDGALERVNPKPEPTS